VSRILYLLTFYFCPPCPMNVQCSSARCSYYCYCLLLFSSLRSFLSASWRTVTLNEDLPNTIFKEEKSRLHSAAQGPYRYPLAGSAAGPYRSSRGLKTQRGEIRRKGNEQKWEEREHPLPLSLCIQSILA